MGRRGGGPKETPSRRRGGAPVAGAAEQAPASRRPGVWRWRRWTVEAGGDGRGRSREVSCCLLADGWA